jgi:immune inhibitor A
MDRNTAIVAVVAMALVACLCACLVVTGLAGVIMLRTAAVVATEVAPIITDVFNGPFASPTATRAPVIVQTPVPTPIPGSLSTLQVLAEAFVPQSDLRESAMRLKGIPDIPITVSDTPTDYREGDELDFFVTNTDTLETFTVTAQMIYRTENVYFFAERGLRVDAGAVQRLVDDFQNNTYPTNRAFFGSEWFPGVDGDPRLYILYARGMGFSVAGYYASADQYSRLAHEYSNEKEMFYINADTTGPNDPSLPGTLAHEFQHMIHWHQDRNEETWMNEGASVLAEFINGHGADGFDRLFVGNPDLQLNAWTEGGPDAYSPPHYGAGFLFMAYFLDRFGNDATQALVAHPANGLRAVDEVLRTEVAVGTNTILTAVDVFADWVIANYLGDPSVGDGRYAYHNYPNAPTVHSPTATHRSCPASAAETVHQYAADYYEIQCTGEVTINFTGSQQVHLVPELPYSGRYNFWGHRNDESHTRLTRAFDLTSLASATLTYRTWYEIEEDWDYAYLTVSADGGQTWSIVRTPSGTASNPTGNNFGWGYTGNSGGGRSGDWIYESIDLTAYTGQEILVSFEYVTDAAVNRAGFLIDDIAVPELGYFADFEADDHGWQAEGFVRVDNLLPQTFVVQVVLQGAETSVQRMELDELNHGSLTIALGSGERAVLVVSGTTPYTTEVASYQYSVE